MKKKQLDEKRKEEKRRDKKKRYSPFPVFPSLPSLLLHPPPWKLLAPLTMMPMITPKSPSADPKISTTRIFTNSVELAASDSAAEEPTTPTQSPHARLAHPVVRPAANKA